MAVTVKLKKAVHVKGKETTTVVLDFDKLTGHDLIAAEAIGCPVDDLFDLGAKDFNYIATLTLNFLGA